MQRYSKGASHCVRLKQIHPTQNLSNKYPKSLFCEHSLAIVFLSDISCVRSLRFSGCCALLLAREDLWPNWLTNHPLLFTNNVCRETKQRNQDWTSDSQSQSRCGLAAVAVTAVTGYLMQWLTNRSIVPTHRLSSSNPLGGELHNQWQPLDECRKTFDFIVLYVYWRVVNIWHAVLVKIVFMKLFSPSFVI